MSAKMPSHPSNMWETAFVYGFFVTFRPCLDQRVFTIEELEESILNTRENTLVVDICQMLLTALGYQQRKTTLEKALLRFIDERVDIEECFPKGMNPLRSVTDFHELQFHFKVHILKCLCETHLVENAKIRDHIKNNQEEEGFAITPLGKDSKKRIYWRVGENSRIYRETRRKKMLGCVWETVAKNVDDLEILAIGLAENSNRDQESLRRLLVEDMIPQVQADILREERKLLRLASLRKEPPTLRTRRKRVNYNDDEVLDDLVSDRTSDTSSQSEPLEVLSTRKAVEPTPYISNGTRRSKRLNSSSVDPDMV
ncbi:hypothetical protein K493DRAFT_403697 [Basidiobolus meristosporus CBS 931.73]|uniref:DDT domain-containing protein n=1 Tax=Basidiobolus meristosporus CBS 931.73 TaxID=1314790 RepID=A0A1Y1ZBA5_9FUNG|nr:hypothetical protein K493DRAFT_403697 [Basidiobolus meristosporus CBS 931.73]|eukprot:ORY07466.1 hypothetical protein K493DRAFT_403697 [Basidiobolus meristosporus CBS 931.73]